MIGSVSVYVFQNNNQCVYKPILIYLLILKRKIIKRKYHFDADLTKEAKTEK